MKINKLTRNEDYIRFSFNVELEVNNFISAKIDCFGGYYKEEILTHNLTLIDDLDYDIEWYVGGKKVNYKGFKEMYNNLFQDDFENLNDQVYNFIYTEVCSNMDNTILDLPKSSQKNIIKLLYNTANREISDDRETMLNKCFNLFSILRGFGINIETLSFTKLNGETSYGVAESHIKKEVREKLNIVL